MRPQAHTGSYYAATVNEVTNFAPLLGEQKADVCVIGGISGEKNIAKHLGEDADNVCRELRWAGNDIIRERVQKYDIQCDLKFGYLDVAIKERHLRDQEADFGAASD